MEDRASLYAVSSLSEQKNLIQAVRWMGDNVEEDVLELVKTVFEEVKVEAEMHRPATKTGGISEGEPTKKSDSLNFTLADLLPG